MRSRLIRRGVSSLTAIVVAAMLAGTVLVAQTGARWTPPLNPDGHPDLEGVWENNSATPLERPAQLAAKPRLTDDELEAMKRRAAALFTAESDAVFGDALVLNLLADRRYSGLGATGHLQSKLAARSLFRAPDLAHRGPSRRKASADDARGDGGSRGGRRVTAAVSGTGAGSDDHRSLHLVRRTGSFCRVHERVSHRADAGVRGDRDGEDSHVRIIWLDGRPHVPPSIRNYMGDSRGRWVGDTLVVETTNFHPNGNPMGGLLNRASPNLRLTERFRRTSAACHRVHLHRGRSRRLEQAVDGDDPLAASQGRRARIRLP